MPSLDDLPPDILYEIHHLSSSPSLPLVNHYLHYVLSNPTPLRAARWLIRKYHATYGDARFVERAVECAVCGVEVLTAIERIWEVEYAAKGEGERTPWFGIKGHETERRLRCGVLPKRIFRPSSTTTALPPPESAIPGLLIHLFKTYSSSPNSHRGYPLSRAVLAGDKQLVTYLRTQGADPSERDFLAVEIALKKRDLGILRLLIDGPDDHTPTTFVTDSESNAGEKRKLSDSDSTRPHKRRKPNSLKPATKVVPVKLSQPLIDTALTKGTPEIIQYIIHEKGYMPSLRSIVKLK